MTKLKNIIKHCDKHGITDFTLETRGSYRCKKCRSEAVSKRRKQLKEELIKYKGGSCSICGYNKCNAALDFHHLDPSKKDFALGYNGLTKSLNSLKKEADKCILVCSNCHRELHNIAN